MNPMRNRPARVVLCAMVPTGWVVAVAPSPALTADASREVLPVVAGP